MKFIGQKRPVATGHLLGRIIVRRMKEAKYYLYAVISATGMMLLIFVAISTSPYLYTKVFGNTETEHMHAAYSMGCESASIKQIINYASNNNLVYIHNESEGVVSLHANTEGHGETVLIWHNNKVAIGARFEDFL